jgi:hypothetical protein
MVIDVQLPGALTVVSDIALIDVAKISACGSASWWHVSFFPRRFIKLLLKLYTAAKALFRSAVVP